MKKVLISHPFGNQNLRHAALAFAESGLLAELWVGAAWDDEHLINLFLPAKLSKQLQRRSFPKMLKPFIRQTFVYEATRMILSMNGLQNFGSGRFSVVAAHEHMDKKVAVQLKNITNVGLIYGYDHCALETFKVAKQRNIRRILELPIPSWREHINILKEEFERFPDWFNPASTIKTLADGGAHKDAELELSEMVVAPCDFVKQRLLDDGYASEIIKVIPYGAPPVTSLLMSNNPNQPLKILYVGSIGLRKGVPYLFDAIQQLAQMVRLTFIGSIEGNHPNVFKKVSKHTWYPSLPHAQVLEQMRQHDVLVFPSLYEGFGLVILEALSQGLPVITTPNTGGTHVIEDGINGFIVPIRSSDAIVEKLMLLNSDREMLQRMRQGAIAKANEYTWGHYGNQLVKDVSNLLC